MENKDLELNKLEELPSVEPPPSNPPPPPDLKGVGEKKETTEAE